MRKFIPCFILFTWLNVCNAQELAKGLISNIDIFNTSMVDGVSCFRIPSIVTAKNGDLIAAIDERVQNCGDLVYNNNINIVVRRSKDNGRTWGAIERAVDFPIGKSASDPSMIVDGKSGHIFLFYNFMDLENHKGIYRLHYVKSMNNGKSWSEPVDITSSITKPEWESDFKFITSGRGIYTSDGKILHTLVNLQRGLHIFGSNDHGRSWYFIDNPIKPADESKIVELSDNSLMVNSRVNGAGYRFVHKSSNDGAIWNTVLDPVLEDPSCNGSIISYTRVADGYDKDRLLFSNAANKKSRENLTVRISYDNGKTWSYSKVIYTESAAYSSLTILKNGDIALFYEKDGYTKNEVVTFSLEWLTNGEDSYSKPKRVSKKN